MPILIVILIGWFNWLAYSVHHRLQPLSAKMCLNRYLLKWKRGPVQFSEWNTCRTTSDWSTGLWGILGGPWLLALQQFEISTSVWTALAAPQYSSNFSCYGTSFQCSWVHCQPTSEQSYWQLSWGHDDGSLQQISVRLMEWTP